MAKIVGREGAANQGPVYAWRARPGAGAAAFLACAFALSAPLAAQAPSCPAAALSPWGMGGIADRARALEIEGSAPAGDPLRTGSRRLVAASCPAEEAALRPLPVGASAAYRSAYPVDRNDGARWSGRGLSLAAVGGAVLDRGTVRAVLAPTATWQENADFTLAPTRRGAFTYPYHQLDWPQRHGGGAFAGVGLGQSALAADLGPVAVRLAEESLWWGPAHRYPILLGNSAAGFPHLAVTTARPLWVGVGHLRSRLMWGRLDESDHFDEVAANDHRLLTGFFADLTPWFLPGLTLGGGIFYHLPWDEPLSKAFDLFTFAVTEEENSQGNALASVTARWRLPASRFEVYVEWAREDFWLNTEDLLTEPDHSQGYVVGFGKLVEAMGGDVFIEGEWTSLQTHSEHRGVGGNRPRFYAHSRVSQGHTHRGQLLGSAIGPGSDAQFLAATRLEDDGRSLGLFLERVRRDEDAYYKTFVNNYGFRGHDVEWSVGAHGSDVLGSVALEWSAAYNRRKNRTFIGLDARSWDFLRENNLTLELGAWWVPR